ncbi:LuxR C-terminal-related transcriptional regulator [Streptomyces sp. TRM68367]|uniref:LuxR C-terminal-related transcriptional regulator n=1 Tax=Streptomyces sp. TRM68367 TaxID=2758415 RepID=UPI00165A66BE|nr:LuxR C-terminal-related transcriptional regulator [Streptomyces sp. TRM68367]MBC9728355.1 response regulator transcription factor [Streptomyces sp. TRM68367]
MRQARATCPPASATVAAVAAKGQEAHEAARSHRPDVILLDVRMPGESETVREPVRRGAAGYLVHGEFTTNELVEAVRDIKRGWLPCLTLTATASLAQANIQPPTTASDLSERLSQVQPDMGQSSSCRSRFQLSGREAEIMDLIASGMNNQQIAAGCFISAAKAAAKWLGAARVRTQYGADRR